MGAFLDKPIVEKTTESGDLPDGSVFGYSTMQGWRTSQEDAHTCVPEFDSSHPGRHLFGVFDGHGGPDVARYLAETLPQYLLDTSSYQEGDFEQALKDAFLGLDAKLLQLEVIATLKRYAKEHAGEEDSDPEAMAEEALTLREEAKMPLDSLLKRFRGVAAAAAARRRQAAADDDEEEEEEDDDEGSEKEEAEDAPDVEKAANDNSKEATAIDDKKPDESGSKEAAAANGDEADESETAGTSTSKGATKNSKEAEHDGEDDEDIKDKDYVPNEDNGDAEAEDESEEAEEDADEEEDEEEEEDDEEEEDSEEEESESEEEYDVIMPCGNDPGVDSGSTAVVALIVGKQLYVANAGDSRAVLSDAGKAVDMSIDHKPEDDEERKRIEAAGGHVTREGRVNGGLNLSRALGDHAYKQKPELTAAKQIISPLPDVRTVTLTDSHRFLLLACDGIWNSMSSQEAVDFCEKRLDAGMTPAKVCEALMDHCLAPDARESDGTGCDNMTAVLLCFARSQQSSEARKRPLSARGDAAAATDSNGESESKRVKEGP